MARTSSDGHGPTLQHDLGHDTIDFGTRPTGQPYELGNTHNPSADDKNASLQAEQYGVDSEKQSERVGSLRAKSESDRERGPVRALWDRHWKVLAQLLTFMVFTAWWVYGLVFYRHTDGKGWLIPTLLYIAILIRLITIYIPASLVLIPARFIWINTVVRVYDAVPAKLHQPIAGVGTFAVFLIGSFVPEETGDNTRANRAISIFGFIVMLVALTATSRNWRIIPWHTVIGGMLTQFIIAVFVLKTQAGYDIFKFISDMARQLLGFAGKGLAFLTDPDWVNETKWFLTGVIPAIIFFIALVQMLYYVGFLQWFIAKFAVFFFWSLRVSGAEAVVAAATPFIGQGESAMLIRPFMDHLTMAEIHQILTCGFATIAGSVLVAYIGMGLNAQALVSSCIMSIPATLAVSKLRYPETQTPMTAGKVEVPKNEDDEHTVNALHAFTNGSWFGLKIGATIVACLLTVIAFVGLINGLLGWWGGYWGLAGDRTLSLEFMLGYILYPIAWLLGVPKNDLRPVGELIGKKIIINEYAAFSALVKEPRYLAMAPRSKLIATYACCGFGNIGSLGIQIGVLSQISPKRSGDVVKVSISAFFCGVLSTLTSASIAGMLFTDGML
ncbi:hypothetical protein VTI74DRAFT_1733 [Chaetomium olivicolor]